MTTRLIRFVLLVLAAALIAVVVMPAAAASIPSSVDAPADAAPLRYRDEVFSNVTKISDLQYGTAPDNDNNPVALKLDLYEPAGDTATDRPALVWVHGGGYSEGDKASGPSSILAKKFAKLGYVSVSINYRLLVANGCDARDGVPPECYAAAFAAIHDAQAAVRWLRANAATYKIDTERIGIGGESAGAITAVGAGIIADQPGDSGYPDYPSNVKAWVSISGGVPEGVFVDGSDAPGYLFSGTADRVVPYQWSVDTAAALQNAGVGVVFKTLDGAEHVPWDQYQDLFETQSDYFFYRYLDVDHSAEAAAASASPAATATTANMAALPSTGYGASERSPWPATVVFALLGVVVAAGLGAAGAFVRRER